MSLQWFLALEGVVGESVVEGHEGEIEVDSLGWGAAAETSTTHGGGAGAGRVHVEPLTLSARAGRASPALFLLAAQGKHVRSAVLSGRSAGEGSVRLVEIALEEVTLAAWHLSDDADGDDQDGGGPGDSRRDAVSLVGRKVRYSVWSQQPDGSIGDPAVAEWDQQGRAWAPPALPNQR